MIVLAGLVLAVGLGDLVSSLSGRPESRTRAVAGAVVGSAAAILLFVLADIGWDRVAAGSILIALTATFWQGARCMDGAWTPRGALPTLAALVVPLALAIAASAWFPAAQGTVARVVQRLPYAVVGVDPDHLLMVLAFLLLMGSTGNAVVRLALAGVGTPVAVGEARLRGGRLIGPLERVLIFGLALGGQPTAAALVISAKGLLRFPELNDLRGRSDDASGSGSRRIDEVTEYLLVGSLMSWIVALAPLPLLA